MLQPSLEIEKVRRSSFERLILVIQCSFQWKTEILSFYKINKHYYHRLCVGLDFVNDHEQHFDVVYYSIECGYLYYSLIK
jgi:hypothetical protein